MNINQAWLTLLQLDQLPETLPIALSRQVIYFAQRSVMEIYVAFELLYQARLAFPPRFAQRTQREKGGSPLNQCRALVPDRLNDRAPVFVEVSDHANALTEALRDKSLPNNFK